MPGDELIPYEETPDENRLSVVQAELAQLTQEVADLAAGISEPGTDLVPTRSSDPDVARQQLAAMRSEAQKKQMELRAKREEFKALMEQQLRAAEVALGPVQELVEHLQESIFTISLYQGANEELHLLRDGESAPAEDPITLRQMVLFMDEECAVAAEEGGIRATDAETFDAWLMENPAHLHQVLPETKGIVALRPRRRLGPRATKEEAEANARTYWLIRNGERVYRTVTQLQIGDRVLPKTDEWDALFSRSHRGHRVPLVPGSFEWERAQKSAAEAERQYMRIGLVLEGLLHRTPIFHPLPEDGISFLDPECVADGRVRYITDAEALLTTGSETFEQWRKRLAGELRVGMRIVLGPGLKEFYDVRSNKNERLSPEHANHPNAGEVFTIEERVPKSGALKFRYREGQRWVNSGGYLGGENREPKRRATCTVYPSDDFLLPFDLAEVADMERFLSSRTDRHHYEEMFPILQTAIAAKKREVELEAPFRTMLCGVMAREAGSDVSAAERRVDELIDWFKRKNRYHRPLVAAAHQDAAVDADAAGSDWEAKAVRMISAEFKRRLADERRTEDPEVVAKLRAEHPHALLIGRPRRAGYVVLDPAEGAKDVWVHETTYSAKGEFAGRREWVLPGGRHRSWKVIFESERWARWDLVADEREHLRGPERDELIESVVAQAQADGALAVAFDEDRTFTVWRLEAPAKLDSDRPESARQKPPTIRYTSAEWQRKKGQVSLVKWSYGGEAPWADYGRRLPWDAFAWAGGYEDWRPKNPKHNVVWRNTPAVVELEGVYDQYKTIRARGEVISKRARQFTDSVEAEWERRAEEAERARFDEDFGDPELWEAHKQTKQADLRFPHREYNLWDGSGSFSDYNKLRDAVVMLIESGIDPEGMTVAEACREAQGRFGHLLKRWTGRDELVRFEYPADLADYVLHAPPMDEQRELEAAQAELEDDED